MNKYQIYKEVQKEIEVQAFEIGLRNGKPDNWTEAEEVVKYKCEQEELQDTVHRG